MKHTRHIIVLALIIFSCGGNDDTNSNVFRVQNLLEDIVNQQILPSINDFVVIANNFNDSVNDYIANPNETDLQLLREEWLSTAIAYEATYGFYIGALRDQFTHLLIYNWPTNPNIIETTISDNEFVTDENFEIISPRSKSFAAIEYLLFGNESSVSETNILFSNSQNRRNYLRISTANMRDLGEFIQNIWGNNASEGYASTFLENNNSGIQGSFNLLFNGLFNSIDVNKVTKIGKPAGLETSEVTNSEIVQARFSRRSLDLVRSNIENIERVYFNPSGLGISDYVFSITEDNILNNAIQSKLTEIYTAIDEIPGSLHDSVSTARDSVEILHTRLEELRVLFAVDVRSILSIVITTTDVDGD